MTYTFTNVVFSFQKQDQVNFGTSSITMKNPYLNDFDVELNGQSSSVETLADERLPVTCARKTEMDHGNLICANFVI